MTSTPSNGTPPILESLVIQARITPAGRRFVAAVAALDLPDADGNPKLIPAPKLGLEGSGTTPAAAANALVQAMRNWLERHDTAGTLPETLGIPGSIDDDTEIILHFPNAD